MSQRDRLLGRQIPPTEVRIRIDYTTPGVDRLFTELQAAAVAENAATPEGLERFRAAQAACDPYSEVLAVSAIPANEYDALVSEHPPSTDQREIGHVWNPDTFWPALLAACIGQNAVDPMTEKDWAEWGRIPGAAASGEIGALFAICLSMNDRSPDMHVGKG